MIRSLDRWLPLAIGALCELRLSGAGWVVSGLGLR